ncbi:bola domain protein [Rhexocercosporidium sp. MPI-PUGE-AT-0058]|nr:bola domain protein [Rhexocercosporidium sp. MPI-PUGE-AT-0058]
MASQTPMEDVMRLKITTALSPSHLEIHNDSHLHSHHKAMAGSTSQETHFRVVITSEAFEKKMQPARHRMVYSLLKEEMGMEGGIHALQLRTRTAEEERRQMQREREEGEGEGEKVGEGGA